MIKTSEVLSISRYCTNISPDEDDAVFYEVAMSVEDAYLVTGNIRHFPKVSKVVTPAEMIKIVKG